MDDAPAETYRFPPFRLDLRRRELSRGPGDVVPLTAKAFDTLATLVRHRDRVVSKNELIEAVWPGRIVEENNLSQAISTLRRALGTDASDHRYIVTVPGRGYRFVADAVEGDESPAAPVPAESPSRLPAISTERRSAERRRAMQGPRLAVAGVGVLLLLMAGLVAWRVNGPGPAAEAPAARGPATLAVLPFRSLSAGPRDELLELGLAETLVTRLGRLPALRVRSLSSARQLVVGRDDPVAVGRELAAAYVVDGSTQRVDDHVRVNVKLLSVPDGRTLLARTFDARIDEVFRLQDEISDAVGTSLAIEPRPDASRTAAPCEGHDASAFRTLLRAHYMLHRRAPETIAKFREAIAEDPTCSRAYAGLATAYLFMSHNDAPPDDVFPLARGAALQALKIDPDSAEAHLAHGRYLQLHDWNWRGAEAAMRRAIELNPSLADAHGGLAHLLVTTGRFEEGLSEVRQARDLDPLSPFINALGGGFHSAAGQPDEAEAWVARALELEPDFWIALLVRGGLALDRGDAEAAVADLRRAADRSRRASQVLAVLAMAEVAAGNRPGAEELLRELRRRESAGYLPPTSLAAAHLALGDTAAALDALERGKAVHDVRIGFIKVDARWNPLRNEPRFRALMQALGLREAPAHGRY
ncbi:winged helix-turn-helix domain-containing tetratricopeptide repeat protein [Luteimonas vadosa]|uniref:OmpR/PhoB-type domain-containing protein n=1 Tax=Luteimonas vadosa TaxID=1165507 RepID=A0ABP9DNT4_9GAMM